MNCLILISNRPDEVNVPLQDVISLQPVPAIYKLTNPDTYEELDMFVEFRTIKATREAKKITGWLNVVNESKMLFMPHVTGGHIISDRKKPTRYFPHWKLVTIKKK